MKNETPVIEKADTPKTYMHMPTRLEHSKKETKKEPKKEPKT